MSRSFRELTNVTKGKGTNYINNFYLEASKCADHVIFVSKWLENIYVDIGMPIG